MNLWIQQLASYLYREFLRPRIQELIDNPQVSWDEKFLEALDELVDHLIKNWS